MITFFYTFLVAFLFNEIYYVYNKSRLDSEFKDKNLSAMSKTDLLYYSLRFLYWIWLGFGCFSAVSPLFIFLIILRLLQFPFFHISRKLYIVWDNLLPAISFMFMLMIIIFKIIG